MSHLQIVYAHPSGHSFTRAVLDAFLTGLAQAGHTATVSDLCAMGFRAEMSLEEYERESAYRSDRPVPAEVAEEQAKLRAADGWAFVYPVWWADCPAVLKGFFDRVFTAGFAHSTDHPVTVRKAVVLCTAGYPIEQLGGVHEAMQTVMLTDRIGRRAASAGFVLLGGPDRDQHLALAEKTGREF